MSALFHDHLAVAVLGSGSRGNCTYIGDDRRGLLVDCGLSTRQVFTRLEAIGLGDATIDAVLVTHEHTDHVGAAGVLSRRITRETGAQIPFFMTRGTRGALNPKVVPERVKMVRGGRAFRWRGWTIDPFTVPHDATDTVGYVVENGHLRVGVITDLGRSTRLVEAKLASLDIAVLEFNHDVEMLMDGDYPWHLKQRIRSPHGHLSNAQSAELLAAAASERLQHVVLAHLSQENNHPDSALEAAHSALSRVGREDVNVHLGRQDVAIEALELSAPVAPPTRARRPRQARRAPQPAPVQISMF